MTADNGVNSLEKSINAWNECKYACTYVRMCVHVWESQTTLPHTGNWTLVEQKQCLIPLHSWDGSAWVSNTMTMRQSIMGITAVMGVNGCLISVHSSDRSDFTHAHIHTYLSYSSTTSGGRRVFRPLTCHIADYSHVHTSTPLLIKEVDIDVFNQQFPWQWGKYKFILFMHTHRFS